MKKPSYIPQKHKNKNLIKDEVIDYFVFGMNSLPTSEFTIVCHGGELLFYGVKPLIEKTNFIVKNSSKKLRFSLQTNLIIESIKELDDLTEYCNIFTEGRVGTSFFQYAL